jgi:hypothetical protein
MTNGAARAAAGVIALVAWIGLAVQFAVVFENTESIAATLVALLAYFTIITNFVVGVVLTCVAAGSRAAASSWIVAGTALSIILVGTVYQLLLRNLYHLSGGAAFSNVLMHELVPILTPLFWLVFVPKGRLRFRDPLRWSIYPLAYFAYALARGAVSGFYPYPFMDVARIGWGATALNATIIAACFLAVGWAIVGLDARLGRRSRK